MKMQPFGSKGDPAEKWWRIQERHFAPSLDEFDNPRGRGRRIVELQEFWVIKHTPKGVWLSHKGFGRRFVLNGATKQYASPTKEKAFTSFFARKKKQMQIYNARVRDIEDAIRGGEILQSQSTRDYVDVY